MIIGFERHLECLFSVRMLCVDVYVYVVVLSWRASSDAGINVGHWVWVNNDNHGGHAAGGGILLRV